ncbi:MAG: tRNA (adenosine(37)-N6)-threonylcarbamoyltransferase complex transferase subunit TsaD [Desulfovibrionaceae bacterium]
MVCLGIETSCDETALALVSGKKILSQSLYSQVATHGLFGGVVPEIASREHYTALETLIEELFTASSACFDDITSIAVSRGPGLLGSLLVGIAFAKALHFSLDKPLLGINHLHAHILVNNIENTILYPALAILVSGGHTHIYYVTSPLQFTLLGYTLDDAVGEVYDKVGKMMGMPYPSGKLIDLCSQKITARHNTFTAPYIHNSSLNYSFSGLKTSAMHYIQKNPDCCISSKKEEDFLNNQHVQQLCADLAYTISHTLANKFVLAYKHCKENAMPVHSFLLAGGVASNTSLRSVLHNISMQYTIPLLYPSMPLCTDNAIMVAYTGDLLHSQYGYYHTATLSAIPRGQHIPNDYILQRV